MPRFTYKGIDSEGKPVSGEIESSDRKQATQKLRLKKILPSQVKQIGNQQKQNDDPIIEGNIDFFAQEREQSDKKRFFQKKQNPRGLGLSFFQKLLVLLKSGLPLGDTLKLLSARLSDPQLKELTQTLWKKISEGHTFSRSLADMPHIFSDSTIHLIEAGESSGNLIPVMEKVVEYLEESAAIKRELKANMAYPLLVISLAFGVVAFFIFFLLPKIRGMMETLGGKMPWIAKFLISSSDALVKYGPFMLAIIFIVGVSIKQWRKTPRGKIRTDLWLLKLPFIGNIYLFSSIFQTSSLMATLMGSGVTTTETLRLVERTISNSLLKAKFSSARKQIQEGVSMATAIKRVHYMPDMAMDILTVGENTGNITNSLNDINRIYRDELSQRLSRMTKWISTLALLFAFSLVCLIALSIVFSVFAVTSSLNLG